MFAIFLDTAGAGTTEPLIRHLLWYAAIFGSFTSTVFFGMVMVAAFRYVRTSRKGREQVLSVPTAETAAVTILKPVHGLEPRLEQTLESFFQQDYPDFEIIFGARSRDNQALTVVEKALCPVSAGSNPGHYLG